jgi:hypothetical protein
MTRIGRIVPLAVALFLSLFAASAFASNVTVSGTVNFSALDGSVDDEDHAVNGVFTVSGDLVVNGTILCIDDSGRTSACPMSFNVGHDLIVNAGGAIYAENRTGTGSGAPITFTVGHDLVLHGPTSTLAGAIVSSDSTSSSGSTGGNITATVSNAVTIESGATIDSGSANAAAGAISIVAGGHIDAGGNVLAGPSRTILSTRLTGDVLSGGTGNQVGGAITLKSTSFLQPGVTVGSNANVVSQGQVTSAGPVLLEGCGVVVNGLVASIATQDATARVVIRSGKSIDVDARDLGVAGATLGRNGKIRGDAPTGTAINHTIDLFAYNDVTVLGPDPAASTLFAISGTPGANTSKSDGATVRVISLNGGVTASGNVLVDGHTASGDDGGTVTVSAKNSINLDHAVVTNVGDFNTNNNNRGGGTIAVRSYSGNVVWTSGTGDVRPVGSGSGLPSSAQGSISITACGTINLGGSTFPTNGAPVGVFPGQTTSACSPAAPSLPAGEPALPLCCNVITITNPAVTDGTVGAAFSQTFTQSGAIGTATFTLFSGTLPAGLTLSASGVLSGTPSVVGTFPIVVKVTDSQGCTGVGTTYNLHIGCQTITVTNPAANSTQAGAAFSATFTQSGAIGGATFTTSSTLPAGLSLSSAGVLSGTPTQTGTFTIIVTVTDGNGCTGSTNYTLTVTCQPILVTNPSTSTGTVNAAFSATFTQSGAIGGATFSTSSTLPNGLSFSSTGVLSGTPTQTGTFPIVVTVVDANSCSGTGVVYNLVIGCQTITVTNPSNASGTVAAPFSEQFTQSGGFGATTFSTSSTLPAGLTLSSAGLLSGTPAQSGTFPIVVRATDSNGCFGDGPTYNLVIACNVITVTNPAASSGTAGTPFSATFTQSGGNGTVTWSESGALPSGIALNASTGVLSGTTTQTGSFTIVVTATDANGCSGSSSYTLTIACQTITVTNPANASGTAGQPFSAAFTASGILGSATWSESGALPSGITLNASTGVLSGTTTQTGTFTIVVKATDSNGCFGTSTYTFTIACQTITVTNPAANSATAGVAFTAQFTATGILGTATWSVSSGSLPSGVTLNPSTGVLSGTPTQSGSFTITVTATDTNGCSGTGAPYTLTVVCPAITVTARGGAFAPGTIGSPYGGAALASGSNGTPYTFAVTSGSLPPGLTLSSSGTISGTPTATGTFTFTITATDAYGCTGSQSFTIAVRPLAAADAYVNLINNTQAVVTGGAIASPTTPFVPLSGRLTANDQPSGATVTAGTFSTAAGGSVQIASDGTFLYTPPVTFVPLTADSFTYTISSDTGGTGTPTTATGTASLVLANRVWYINPNAAINGNGQSQSAWRSTASIAGTNTGDILFVYDNGGSTANTSKGITLLNNQTLWGQGVTLVVNSVTLVNGGAGQAPTLTATSPGGNVVNVADNNLIRGVILANDTFAMIAGSPSTLTVENSTLQPTLRANGIDLSGATGSVTLTNVGIVAATAGEAIKVTGGTATWSAVNSPVSQTAGRALFVSGMTGGGMTFDAASTLTVSAGASDGAMSFSSNSGAFTFHGDVSLTVTGSTRGLLASSNGGTIAIDGAGSTITAGGGAAIDFQNTTIAAAGLNFRSVSANGGLSGIILNNTGTQGGLTVAGNGGTCVNTASTCTGGTIQNTSGHGVQLTSTKSPSFSFVKITTTVGSGIYGTGVTNFTLANSVVDGVNNGHTSGDGNVVFAVNAGGATENNLSGAVSITNNALNNSYADGIRILNYAGTIGSLTITGNTLTSATSSTSSTGNAIFVNTSRGAAAAQVSGGSISGNTIANFPSGGGIVVFAGTLAAGPAVAVGSAGSPLLIQDNTITGFGTGTAGLGTNGIQTTVGHQSSGYFTIGASGHPNTITNVRGNGVACSLFGTSTAKCAIAFNTIVANNTAGSAGINTGADQATGSSDAGTLLLDIHDNNVSKTNGNGILATVRSASSSGIFHIQNNTVGRPTASSGTIYGIRVDSGNGIGAASVCLKISGNSTIGSTNGTTTAPGIGLRVQHTGTSSTMQIDGLTPSPAADGGQMETYVGNTGQNPGSANGSFGVNGVSSISSGATYTASTCTIP